MVVRLCTTFNRCCCMLILCCVTCWFFFFKQKTAYEMRISDWSSDVCSSDLAGQDQGNRNGTFGAGSGRHQETARRHAQGRCHHIAGQRGAGRDLGQIVELAQQRDGRSEEHTSELQSLMRISYAVFCLKKKKKTEIY